MRTGASPGPLFSATQAFCKSSGLVWQGRESFSIVSGVGYNCSPPYAVRRIQPPLYPEGSPRTHPGSKGFCPMASPMDSPAPAWSRDLHCPRQRQQWQPTARLPHPIWDSARRHCPFTVSGVWAHSPTLQWQLIAQLPPPFWDFAQGHGPFSQYLRLGIAQTSTLFR